MPLLQGRATMAVRQTIGWLPSNQPVFRKWDPAALAEGGVCKGAGPRCPATRICGCCPLDMAATWLKVRARLTNPHLRRYLQRWRVELVPL
jgi:hypothetical protein